MLRSLCVILFSASAALAAGPTTRPSTQPAGDPDLDFVVSQGQKVSGPAKDEKPASSPFIPAQDSDTRQGTITTSDGEKIHGKLSHTAEKPVRVWVEAEMEYHDIPFKLIARFEATVTSEYDEKEWHFKESGSDIKEFTGKSYPCRETSYTLTLVNGQTITGGIVEPIYLQTRDGPYLFSLLKRDKGKVGQTLKQLIYVKRVDFADVKPGKKE